MKKLFCIIIAAALLLPLAACAGKGTEDADISPDGTAAPGSTEAPENTEKPVYAHTGPDFDNRFGRGYSDFIETENAYYFKCYNANYLYYYDKLTGDSGVLCSKPECIHDSNVQNKSCDGYLYTFVKSISQVGDRLYYVSAVDANNGNGTGIYAMALDGSDKEINAHIDLQGIEGLTPSRYDYHRGMLYGWSQREVVKSGSPLTETRILGFDPETGEMHTLFYDESEVPVFQPSLFYYEDYVYFCIDTMTGTVNEETGEITDSVGTLLVGRINIQTEVYEEVYFGSRDVGFGSYCRLWVESEDRIYIVPMLSALYEDTCCVYLLSGGELSTEYVFENPGASYIADGAAVCIFPDERHAEIWGTDGIVIYNGIWTTDFEVEPGTQVHCSTINSVYGDRDTLYVVYTVDAKSSKDRKHSDYCVVRYDLTRTVPEATLLMYVPYNR